MEDIATAFEALSARVKPAAGAQPLDRISVRDYTRDVEIGAFKSERGQKQRIRFNVVLEVSRHTAAQSDDVDKVISYDLIVEAIEAQLSTERINLLETLAERVAERCLTDRRVVKAYVRIEKLDRIPGALGVEIVRFRLPGGTSVLPSLVPSRQPAQDAVNPMVVFLPNVLLKGPGLAGWIAAIKSLERPCVICVEPIDPAEALSGSESARRIGLLSIEQNAWQLAGMVTELTVVDSRTELDWAIKHGVLAVWAPSKIVTDALEKPTVDASDPIGLARWFAHEFSAHDIVVAGDGAEPGDLAGLAV